MNKRQRKKQIKVIRDKWLKNMHFSYQTPTNFWPNNIVIDEAASFGKVNFRNIKRVGIYGSQGA